MNAPAQPFVTAGEALGETLPLLARIAALTGALSKARNFVAELQHDADPEAHDLLAEIDRTLKGRS